MKTTIFMSAKFLLCYVFFFTSLNADAIESNLFDWKFKTGGDVLGSVLASDSMLYVGSHDSCFYAISTSGQKIWQFKTNYPIQSTAIIYDSVVCFQNGNRLTGLHKTSGQQLWKHEPEEVLGKEPTLSKYSTDLKSSSPVLSNNCVYYGNEYGNFYGINVLTGEEVYNYQTQEQFHIRTTAMIENDTAYFGNDEGYVYAISLSDTSLIWKARTNDGDKPYGGFAPVVGQLKTTDSLLFFGILNGEYQVLNKHTGTTVWSVGDKYGSWYSGIPVIKNNVLYQGTSDDKTFKAFNPSNGEVIWSASVERGLYNACVFFNDVIIVLGGYKTYEDLSTEKGSGRLVVLDYDGKVLNRISLEGSVFGTPTILNDKLYYGSRDNHVYCLDLNTITKDARADVIFDAPEINLGVLEDNSVVTLELATFYNMGSKSITLTTSVQGNNLPDRGVSASPPKKLVNAQDSTLIKVKISPARFESGDYSFSYSIESAAEETSEFYFSNNISFTIDQRSSMKLQEKVPAMLTFFPNPFSEKINLHFNSETEEYCTIRFYSNDQKVLKEVQITPFNSGKRHEIDLSNLLPGHAIIHYQVYTNKKVLQTGSLLLKK